MNSAEVSGGYAGKVDSASPETVESYVSAVDDLLLDVPWRRRRQLVADLREHLRENPEQITVESPQEYAAELRATAGAFPGGRLAGFRSAAWPTPVQWCESVLRGGALTLVVLVIYGLLDAASQALLGDRSAMSSWQYHVNAAFQTVYPMPRILGSHKTGLLIFVILAVLVGQLSTAAVLSRGPHRRPMLRRLSYVSLAVVAALIVMGALQPLA